MMNLYTYLFLPRSNFKPEDSMFSALRVLRSCDRFRITRYLFQYHRESWSFSSITETWNGSFVSHWSPDRTVKTPLHTLSHTTWEQSCRNDLLTDDTGFHAPIRNIPKSILTSIPKTGDSSNVTTIPLFMSSSYFISDSYLSKTHLPFRSSRHPVVSPMVFAPIDQSKVHLLDLSFQMKTSSHFLLSVPRLHFLYYPLKIPSRSLSLLRDR